MSESTRPADYVIDAYMDMFKESYQAARKTVERNYSILNELSKVPEKIIGGVSYNPINVNSLQDSMAAEDFFKYAVLGSRGIKYKE